MAKKTQLARGGGKPKGRTQTAILYDETKPKPPQKVKVPIIKRIRVEVK
jgi:hypothetical protein